MDMDQANVFLDYMNDLIHQFRAKYNEPYIIIAGDWNRADTATAFEDFPFLNEVLTPPMRGDENLDIIFTNMQRSITGVDVCPPLVQNAGQPGRPSDHNIVVVNFELERKRSFKWLKYSYRKCTKEGDVAFGEWLVGHDWSEVVGDPSQKAEALERTLDQAMSVFFPLITRRMRSD